MNSEIRRAESFSELNDFLADTIAKSNFELSQIKFSDQNEWDFQDGSLSHTSRGFFHVNGLKNTKTNQEHLVLFQPQSATTGLALCRHGKTAYVLLQARIEPGNSNIGQYGPTVQSTLANYLRLHGGKSTPYINMFTSFSPRVRVIENSMQLDIGKRYFQKSKSHIYIELDEFVETEQNMIWAALPAISDAMEQNNFINADLRSLFGIFNWDRFLQFSEHVPDAESSENFISQLIMGKQFGSGLWNLIPVTQLTKWIISEDGIEDTFNSGISVGLYRTVCKNREVCTWVQPLMKASNPGLVRLLMRDHDGEVHFLLSLSREFGVSSQQTILPSYVAYPGDNQISATLPAGSSLVAEIVQSDEGGRFLQHESVYQLILITGEYNLEDNQCWVNAQTLKKLLYTSNMVSFQLRCIASLIVRILNPYFLQGKVVSTKEQESITK